jgi:hypothetical protein
VPQQRNISEQAIESLVQVAEIPGKIRDEVLDLPGDRRRDQEHDAGHRAEAQDQPGREPHRRRHAGLPLKEAGNGVEIDGQNNGQEQHQQHIDGIDQQGDNEYCYEDPP